MKTNLRKQLTRYQCFIRPKVHFAPEFSFKPILWMENWIIIWETRDYIASTCLKNLKI